MYVCECVYRVVECFRRVKRYFIVKSLLIEMKIGFMTYSHIFDLYFESFHFVIPIADIVVFFVVVLFQRLGSYFSVVSANPLCVHIYFGHTKLYGSCTYMNCYSVLEAYANGSTIYMILTIGRVIL